MSCVPAGVRQAVLERDRHRCVAPQLDDLSGQCRDSFGRPNYEVPEEELEMDHVRPEPMMGKEPPSEPRFLVSLCPWHHRGLHAGRNWATSHRAVLRAYLARKHGARKGTSDYDEGGQLLDQVSPADESSRAQAGGSSVSPHPRPQRAGASSPLRPSWGPGVRGQRPKP